MGSYLSHLRRQYLGVGKLMVQNSISFSILSTILSNQNKKYAKKCTIIIKTNSNETIPTGFSFIYIVLS